MRNGSVSGALFASGAGSALENAAQRATTELSK